MRAPRMKALMTVDLEHRRRRIPPQGCSWPDAVRATTQDARPAHLCHRTADEFADAVTGALVGDEAMDIAGPWCRAATEALDSHDRRQAKPLQGRRLPAGQDQTNGADFKKVKLEAHKGAATFTLVSWPVLKASCRKRHRATGATLEVAGLC